MSDTENTATIRVVADASGVEAGLRPAVDAARRAGDAVSQIGDGASGATQKVEASSRNIIAAIQRTTIAMQAGGKQTAAYYEAIANQRGIDPAVLEPYIAKLREAEAAQNAAGSAAHEFGFQTAAAKREVLVLAHELSQGNYSKFGSSLLVLGERTGAASLLFSAAGAAVIGFGAAVVGVGYEMLQGAQEQRELQNALLVTSNFAGMTSLSIDLLAESMTKSHEVTIGTAKEFVTALTSSGKIGGDAIKTISGFISDFAKSTNQSVADLAPKMIALFSDPIKGAEELNSTMHFLTVTQQEHIAALVRTGEVQKAQDELAEAASAHIPKQADNLGFLAKQANYVAEAWSNMINAMKGWGAADNDPAKKQQAALDEIAQLKAMGADMSSSHIKQLQAEADALGPAVQRQKEQAKAIAATAAAIDLQSKSWDAVKTTSTAYQIQVMKDQLTLVQKLNPANADQSAAKSDSIRVLTDQIASAYRSMGAETRQLAQQQASDAENYNLLVMKGQETRLQDQLALGVISKEQFDQQSTQVALQVNQYKQSYELQQSQIAGLTDAERQAHLDKLKFLREEADQIKSHGAATVQIDEKNKYDEIIKATTDAGAATISSLDEQILKQREHNAEIGKTAAQIELAKEAQVDLATAQLQSDADYLRDGLAKWDLDEKARAAYQIRLNNLDDEIAARRTLAGLLSDGAVREADAKAAADAATAWKKAANTIENDLTSAILDGGGKGWKKLVHDMEMAFAKMVLQPILEPISGGLATTLSPFMGNQTIGAGQAGGATGAIGLAQTASAMYGAVTGGLTLGGGLGTGFMGSLAGGLNGAGVGSGLTSAVGLQIGNGIADVVGPSVAGAISTGLGAVATALPWIGAAVAAVSIGKMAFGMGSKQTTDQGISGTLSSAGVSGESYTDWMKKGGWFRSDQHGQDTTALSADVVKQFTQGLSSIEQASTGFAQSLGVSADSIAGYSKTFDIKLTGDATKDQQAVTDFFSGVSDEIAKQLVPSLDQFSKSGETASATLQRLAGDFQATTTAMQLIGKTAAEAFGSAGLDSAAARERLVTLAGGTSTLTSEAQSYNQNYLSDDEKLAPVRKAVDDAMASLGLAAVQTRAQFKAIVDSLDLTTEAGDKEFVSLMALADAFAQVHPAADDAATAADDAATAAQKAADALQALKDSASGLMGDVDNSFTVLQDVTKTTTDAISKRITAEQALSDAVKSTLASMTASGTELSSRAAAQAQIKAAVASVKAGGALPDAASLQDALSTVSKDAADQFSTYADYLKDLYSTKNDVSQLGDAADAALSVDQQQLDSLQAMLDAAQKQIDLLKGIDTTGLTIAQALAGFQTAVLSAQANPINAATSAIGDAYHSALGRAPDSAGLAYYQQAAANGGSLADIVSSIKTSPEAQIQSIYESLLGRTADAGGLQYYMGDLAKGASVSDISAGIMQSDEYKKLHPFAVGTNYIPRTMPALLHEGEAVIPAADNRELMRRLASPGANNAALAAELRATREENRQMHAYLRQIAGSTKQAADHIDGVTNGGTVMNVETY